MTMFFNSFSELESQLSSLRLALTNVARKQLNTSLAESTLLKECYSLLDPKHSQLSLMACLARVRPMTVGGSLKQFDMLKLQVGGYSFS